METEERDILARIAAARAAADQANHERFTAEKELDALRLANRPTFPTEAQRAGLAEAARRIRDRVPCDSHHGELCPPSGSGVIVHGVSGWLGVWSRAPYEATGGSGRLWEYTEDEAQVFRTLIEAEGLVVSDMWQHAQGLSFTTKLAAAP